MANRFPSIEDFDESTPTAAGAQDILEASDLLSREQALLGEDAVMFQTGDENLLAEGGEQFPDIQISGGNEVRAGWMWNWERCGGSKGGLNGTDESVGYWPRWHDNWQCFSLPPRRYPAIPLRLRRPHPGGGRRGARGHPVRHLTLSLDLH